MYAWRDSHPTVPTVRSSERIPSMRILSNTGRFWSRYFNFGLFLGCRLWTVDYSRLNKGCVSSRNSSINYNGCTCVSKSLLVSHSWTLYDDSIVLFNTVLGQYLKAFRGP